VVLAAAREILVHEGWDAVTHLRVAEASGLGRATLYRHWPDRSMLLYDVLAAEELTMQFRPSGRLRVDLLERLELFRRVLADRDMGRVIAALVDRAEWEEQFMTIKTRLVQDHVAFIRELLVRGIEAGELRADIELDLAAAQLLGPMAYRRLISGEELTAEFATRLVDDFLTLNRA
jgi:AcrR family transcriptional regulator